MRRQLQHIIKSEEFLTQISTNEQGVIAFRVESSLMCKVSINADNCFQSLHLKIMPDDQNYWQAEHTLVLQKFFDEKVVAPPYRPNALLGFCRLLNSPTEALKNLIQLMRFEVHPEQIAQNNLKWSISLCLTIPPVAPNVFPVGQAGFISNKEKFLIFMHLTRVNTPPGQDPISVVAPIVYNTAANNTSLASLQRELNGPALNAVQQHLIRWNNSNMNPGRCSILPAIHDLLMNLSLPNESGFTMGQGPPPPGMVPSAMGQPPSGMGQPPSGLGQPPTGMGQATSGPGMGQPPSSMGQPPVSMGQTSSGMGYSQREP